MRLLTYNILKGGQEREAQIVEVIRSVAPDVIVVQEVLEANRFRHRYCAGDVFLLGPEPRPFIATGWPT